MSDAHPGLNDKLLDLAARWTGPTGEGPKPAIDDLRLLWQEADEATTAAFYKVGEYAIQVRRFNDGDNTIADKEDLKKIAESVSESTSRTLKSLSGVDDGVGLPVSLFLAYMMLEAWQSVVENQSFPDDDEQPEGGLTPAARLLPS